MFQAARKAREFLAAMEGVELAEPEFVEEPYFAGWPLVGAFHFPMLRRVRAQARNDGVGEG